jgi:transcriptional regulator with XRE-family HTH domain
LADRAAVDRNYVGMVERSENSVSVDVLEKLAEALEVKPSDFFRLGD